MLLLHHVFLEVEEEPLKIRQQFFYRTSNNMTTDNDDQQTLPRMLQ
jgi:hypothetical protein